MLNKYPHTREHIDIHINFHKHILYIYEYIIYKCIIYREREREREEERDREFFLCKKHGKKTPVKSIALCVENTLLRGGVE